MANNKIKAGYVSAERVSGSFVLLILIILFMIGSVVLFDFAIFYFKGSSIQAIIILPAIICYVTSLILAALFGRIHDKLACSLICTKTVRAKAEKNSKYLDDLKNDLEYRAIVEQLNNASKYSNASDVVDKEIDDYNKNLVGLISNRYCRNCGTKNPPETKICSNCGSPLYRDNK